MENLPILSGPLLKKGQFRALTSSGLKWAHFELKLVILGLKWVNLELKQINLGLLWANSELKQVNLELKWAKLVEDGLIQG